MSRDFQKRPVSTFGTPPGPRIHVSPGIPKGSKRYLRAKRGKPMPLFLAIRSATSDKLVPLYIQDFPGGCRSGKPKQKASQSEVCAMATPQEVLQFPASLQSRPEVMDRIIPTVMASFSGLQPAFERQSG